MKEKFKKEIKPEENKNTLGFILSWIFGLLWLLGGIGFLSNSLFLKGIVYILAGIIFLPPTNNFTEKSFNFSIPLVLKIVILISLIFLI